MVFYGSQTGTAEEFAGRLAKDAARYGMKGMPADPEECEMVSMHSLNTDIICKTLFNRHCFNINFHMRNVLLCIYIA